MKKRLLLLLLASAAVISGCATTAGYRGHGGGYYGSSGYDRYGSDPYGYYGDGYYSGYDRYGYDRYGRSYGYPYGYAPYYDNRYYYYQAPQRPPANNPPAQPDGNRFNPASVQYDPNAQPVMGEAQPAMERSRLRRPASETGNMELSRDLSRYRGVRQVASPPPAYRERPERVQQPVMESPRRMRPMRESMPMPSRAPAAARPAPASDPASLLDSVR